EPDRKIPLASEDAAVGMHRGERRPAIGAVNRLHPSMTEIVDQPRPEAFRLTDDHAFRVLGDFVRAERGMEAAHHHRYAPPSILAGDLVGALRRVGLDADCHQIRGLVERDLLHAIVVEADVHVARRETRDRRRRQGLHLPGPDVALALATPDARVDERESHRRLLNHQAPRPSTTRANARSGSSLSWKSGRKSMVSRTRRSSCSSIAIRPIARTQSAFRARGNSMTVRVPHWLSRAGRPLKST